jgi:4-carboxymuconolactone decarboxylase
LFELEPPHTISVSLPTARPCQSDHIVLLSYSPLVLAAGAPHLSFPFWRQSDMTTLFDQGLAVRKDVLGAEYVENSIKNADDFNRPLQELVTEYCWGAIWTREGLPRKTRSMLNLAMLATLNRPHELELHIRGAERNGVTRDEIREVLLQVAIYAGVPAGVDSFRIARKVFAEDDAKAKK